MRLKVNVIIAIILVITIGYLFGIYYNLDVGETPHEVDIIIVNEGLYEERSETATELLNEGYADQIMVSPASPYVIEWYYNLGVTENQIVRENEATSTWTNATNSLALMEENGWQSALVVSSDYHIRRVKLSYERAKEDLGSDVQLTYISAYPEEDGEEIPYTHHPENRQLAINEVFKYSGYLIGLYHFIDL